MGTTYDQLTANIKTWCGRTDTTTLNNIPQFIAAAQTALDSELTIGEMISTVTYNTDATSIDVSEFMTIQDVLISGLVGTSTTYADITALRQLVNARPETTGYDFHYSLSGNNVELVKPASVTVTGNKKPVRLSSGTQTNAYTDGAENALLCLSLFYCAAFARDDESAQGWETLAQGEIANLNSVREKFTKTGTARVKRRGYF